MLYSSCGTDTLVSCLSLILITIIPLSKRGKKGRERTHLTSSINDLSCKVLSLVLDDLAKGILNRGIITLHEMTIDELNREGGFA